MSRTITASAAGHTALAHSLRGELLLPMGRVNGLLTHECNEVRHEIANPPRRSVRTWIALKLARQA